MSESIRLLPNTAVMHTVAHVWLTNEQRDGFGQGRVRLFRLIDEEGSLSKAAKVMGMSYRTAWGTVKKVEALTGVRLVCAVGSKRDGYSLTPEGRALITAFDAWSADVSQYAQQRAQLYFPLATENSGCDCE